MKAIVATTITTTIATIVATAGVMPGGRAQAQSAYPQKPIRLIAPYATGGAPDILARLYASELAGSLGNIIVENRAGAGGTTGSDSVAKSAPDGYTLLMTTTATKSINPSLQPNIPYDPIKDFTPIGQVANTALLLVVSNSVPAKTLRELVDHARANPGKLTYATAGPGTIQHIAAELMRDQAGIDIVHVAYKGTGQIVPDLVAGRVSMMYNSIAAVLPFVKDGRLRALGVSTPRRNDAAPDVPTIAEAGLAGFEASAWYAVFGPAGMPREIVQRLNAEFTKAALSPKVRERYAALGLDTATSTPEELGAIVKRDLDKWSKVIRERGIKAE